MQLYSQDMEVRCIVTLTNPKVPEEQRSTLLGKLSKDFFHYPPCAAAFNRIDVMARKRFELIDLPDLLEDPALEEDFRDILRDTDVKSCKNKKAIQRMLDGLDSYRKIRIVYDVANDALENIEGEALDVDKLLDTIGEKLTRARRNINEEDQFVVIGKNNNADEIVEDVLNSVVEQMIKTGFTKYDEKNGGLPEEGVMILAATTSGGKSAVLMNLLVNLYMLSKKRVCRISLEMGDRQEMQRLLSRLSQVPFWKIKQNKLSPKEKQRIKKAYSEFNQFGVDNDCVFTSISPTRGLRIDDALRMVKPFGFDVIGIDYVSLLEGVDDENQWRVMSSIVRDCKVFSRENKCLIIVLCQLDADTDRIRYSRGMKEHADVMWAWNYSKKEQRELRIIPVGVDKARDGELFTFELGERFDVMTAENIDGDSGYGGEDDTDESDLDLDGESDETGEDEDDSEEDDYALS